MPSRTTTTENRRSWRQVHGDRPADNQRALTFLPGQLEDGNALFVLRVCLPDVEAFTRTGDDGLVTGFLHDGRSSWATLTPVGDGVAHTCQGGPRRLADEANRVLAHWTREREPSLYDFGMTVLPDGQFTWHKDPDTGPHRLPLAG
ncbi:hypothetical protein [Streptomyces luteireticuli]|uniref:hypothetical protein n=1 Tax=Streptomyces luteireticuli TaxID=173858 RepID=UPI003556BF26